MRRITLTGPELEGFAPAGPASYLKLIFPEPGQTEPVRPLPDGPRAVSMRTYTPLAVRPEALEVDVDFVLHGEGPASTWAAQASVGQILFLMGPGPGYTLDAGATQHLLIADDSALPAVETILAALPASASARVLLEVIDAAEQRPLQSAARLDVQWLARGGDHRAAGLPLVNALRALPAVPPEARFYYLLLTANEDSLPDLHGGPWGRCCSTSYNGGSSIRHSVPPRQGGPGGRIERDREGNRWQHRCANVEARVEAFCWLRSGRRWVWATSGGFPMSLM